jgi:hypothetical protein
MEPIKQDGFDFGVRRKPRDLWISQPALDVQCANAVGMVLSSAFDADKTVPLAVSTIHETANRARLGTIRCADLLVAETFRQRLKLDSVLQGRAPMLTAGGSPLGTCRM